MESPILLLGPGHTSTAVRETQIVWEEKSGGTCSSKGLSGALCFRSRGYRDVRKVRLAAPLEWLQCESKGTDSDIFIPSHSQVY